MKYYLYISDAKVDMLYPQVPHQLKKKIATQFGFDVKILSASRRSETEPEENRITRLETVEQFIREFGRLGSLQRPDDYFEGVMSMGTACFPDIEPMFVYFGAQAESTTVGLWGSLRHLVGQSGLNPGSIPSSSLARDAIWHLIRGLEHDFEPASASESAKVKVLEREAKKWISQRVNSFEIRPERWWELLYIANFETGLQPQQYVEFLAKRLLEHTESGHRVILGTPLYVALADSSAEETRFDTSVPTSVQKT